MGSVSPGFVKRHGEELKAFIYDANIHGYGSDDVEANKLEGSDGSTKITYEKGNWKFQDVYYGGEPFFGQIIVFYKDVACWNMSYHGKVSSWVVNKSYVYDCLGSALMLISPDLPLRGPKFFVAENGLFYVNDIVGDILKFSGHEVIHGLKNDRMFYNDYIGGVGNLW
jgi:hypothetical protein